MQKICKVEKGSKAHELKVTTSSGVHTLDMSEVNKLSSKSAKIRALYAQCGDRSAVAQALEIRYQHVRNVLTQELKKK